ncbi:hypothetical protein TNCV_1839491 [Trichonephila clavipes]|nr:hypothetical protein TNCV_1839491 [Trichonephila clavipes]
MTHPSTVQQKATKCLDNIPFSGGESEDISQASSTPPDMCLSGEHRRKPFMLMPGSNREAWTKFCDGVGRNIFPCIEASRCLERDYHRRPLSKHFRRSSLHPMLQTLFPGERSVFQNDNVPVHTSRCVQTCLHEHDDEVEHLTWCPQSPCDGLKRFFINMSFWVHWG